MAAVAEIMIEAREAGQTRLQGIDCRCDREGQGHANGDDHGTEVDLHCGGDEVVENVADQWYVVLLLGLLWFCWCCEGYTLELQDKAVFMFYCR